MAKDLKLTVSLTGSKAEMAIKGLTDAMNKADKAQQNLEKWAKEADKALDWVKKSSSDAAKNVDSFWNESQQAGTKANRAFTGVAGTLKETWKNILTVTKYAAGLATTFWGIVLAKSISDLRSYTEAFQLMNATLWATAGSPWLKYMEDSLLNLATKIWKPVEEIIDATTQLLSSWFAPTAKEGTQEYMNQLGSLMEVQEKLAMTALGTWETARSMWDAYVFAANALELPLNNMESVNYVMDLFAATLDTGIGTMDEYSQQFVKFVKEGKQAWLTNEEMFWMFSRMTKSMDPNMAWFTTKSLFQFLNDIPDQANRSANAVARALKDNPNLTGRELQVLKKYQGKGIWEDMFYSKELDANGSRIKYRLETIVDNLKWVLTDNRIEKGSFLYDTMLWAFAQNQNAMKWLRDVLSDEGYTDYKNIVSAIAESNLGSGEASQNKANQMMQAFWVKWNQMMQQIRNSMLKMTIAVSPALSAIVEMITDLVQWKEANTSNLEAVFKWVRSEIEKTYPALIPVVNMLERFAHYIASWKAEEHLKGMLNLFWAIGKTALDAYNVAEWVRNSPMFVFLRKVTGDKPLVNLVMAIWGYTAVKWLITAMASHLFSVTLASQAWAAMWVSLSSSLAAAGLGATIWAAIWAAFLWVVLGSAIWQWIVNNQREKLNKLDSIDTDIKNVRYGANSMSPAELSSANKALAESMKKDISFTNWTPEQAKMISEALQMKTGMTPTAEQMSAYKNTTVGWLIDLLGTEKTKRFAQIEIDSRPSPWIMWAIWNFVVPWSNLLDAKAWESLMTVIAWKEAVNEAADKKLWDLVSASKDWNTKIDDTNRILRDMLSSIINIWSAQVYTAAPPTGGPSMNTWAGWVPFKFSPSNN